jgi:dihydroneopterin aldolase
MMTDTMIFKGFRFAAHIGCYEPERSVRQELALEFEAVVQTIPKVHSDQPEHIVLDYAVVSQVLATYFQDNSFRLLETAAEGVAQLLLTKFQIESVTVDLTKRPQDMPQGTSVTYRCLRAKNHIV